MRRFFVKRPKFLAATSNLRVEQNLVHLGRFLHFSQKAKKGWSDLKKLSGNFNIEFEKHPNLQKMFEPDLRNLFFKHGALLCG